MHRPLDKRLSRFPFTEKIMGSNPIRVTYSGVEQLVARWAHNPKVGGSSPSPATKTTHRKTNM